MTEDWSIAYRNIHEVTKVLQGRKYDGINFIQRHIFSFQVNECENLKTWEPPLKVSSGGNFLGLLDPEKTTEISARFGHTNRAPRGETTETDK